MAEYFFHSSRSSEVLITILAKLVQKTAGQTGVI